MSKLLSQLPQYVLQALAGGQQCKLDCLAQLLSDADVLTAMLSQPQPEQLLDALYAQYAATHKQEQQHQHQQQQQQQVSQPKEQEQQRQGSNQQQQHAGGHVSSSSGRSNSNNSNTINQQQPAEAAANRIPESQPDIYAASQEQQPQQPAEAAASTAQHQHEKPLQQPAASQQQQQQQQQQLEPQQQHVSAPFSVQPCHMLPEHAALLSTALRGPRSSPADRPKAQMPLPKWHSFTSWQQLKRMWILNRAARKAVKAALLVVPAEIEAALAAQRHPDQQLQQAYNMHIQQQQQQLQQRPPTADAGTSSGSSSSNSSSYDSFNRVSAAVPQEQQQQLGCADEQQYACAGSPAASASSVKRSTSSSCRHVELLPDTAGTRATEALQCHAGSSSSSSSEGPGDMNIVLPRAATTAQPVQQQQQACLATIVKLSPTLSVQLLSQPASDAEAKAMAAALVHALFAAEGNSSSGGGSLARFAVGLLQQGQQSKLACLARIRKVDLALILQQQQPLQLLDQVHIAAGGGATLKVERLVLMESNEDSKLW
jgi:hypothetical protein